MTMWLQVCLGLPRCRGPSGRFNSMPPGQNIEQRTGSESARLARCPMNSICRLQMSSLSGPCLAILKTVALDTLLRNDGETRKIFLRQRAWKASNLLLSNLFIHAANKQYCSLDTMQALNIAIFRLRLSDECVHTACSALNSLEAAPIRRLSSAAIRPSAIRHVPRYINDSLHVIAIPEEFLTTALDLTRSISTFCQFSLRP